MIRCYVTDRHRGDPLLHAATAVGDGIDLIQVREKDLDARRLFDLVCAIRRLAVGSKTKVLVNGRLDVAIAASIDGVHLPGNGLPPRRVRPLVRTLGCSVHSIDEARSAEDDGADFLIFGPIFETPGKTAVGLDALRHVVQSVRIPVLAIGGISHQNTPSVLSAGASGIAAIRLFQAN